LTWFATLACLTVVFVRWHVYCFSALFDTKSTRTNNNY
jgi:hypothetical protein